MIVTAHFTAEYTGPVLKTNQPLPVDEGSWAAISNGYLQVTDAQHTPAELMFTVVNPPSHGFISLNGSSTIRFTQADIDAGLVYYVHDGSEVLSDLFNFTVMINSVIKIGSTQFTIDVNLQHEPPVVAIVSGPSGSVYTTDVIFTWNGYGCDAPLAQYEYELDSRGLITTDSSTCSCHFYNLHAGDHNFKIRAVDDMGYASDWKQRPFTTTYIWPRVEITSISISQRDATVEWNATMGSVPVQRFEFRLDNGPVTTAADKETSGIFRNLDSGGHIFDITAVDENGFYSDAAKQGFFVDYYSEVVFTHTPPDTTVQKFARFNWRCTTVGDTLDHFELQYDLNPVFTADAADTTHYLYQTDPGAHQFRIRAVDTQGHCSLWNTYTWTVLYVLPRITITSGPDSVTSDRNPTFYWTSFAGSWPIDHFLLRMDDESPVYQSLNSFYYSYMGLADGPHLFRICAYDQRNIASYWDSCSFTIENASSVDDSEQNVPAVFRLSSFPNPFNAGTTIWYEVPRQGRVRVEIFNLRGEHVAQPVDKLDEAGTHCVRWKATDRCPSGIYFCRLSSGSVVKTIRLVLIK